MNLLPKQISLEEWDMQYYKLQKNGLREPDYGGRLSRHAEDGDTRLLKLKYDNSPAALRLWNFLLTEEDRLKNARDSGKKLIGTMKDLGTVPVIAYSFDNLLAFYPDGAWWIPCVMELNAGLLEIADSLGIDESFCPVRAMLGAFATEAHFPIPDFLVCSVGATCDDFSAIAQRLNGMGHPIFWWEIPHRRFPEPQEETISLPGGFVAPKCQLEFVKSELERIKSALSEISGQKINNEQLSAGIKKANQVRKYLSELRTLAFTSDLCPLPALEMLIAEMLAIHFCSDRDETIEVLKDLLDEIKTRIKAGTGFFNRDAVKIFWVNPVADLQVMNLLENCGGRICGTEYLFSHALDEIPENIPPVDALAQMALADPMAGSIIDRAKRICNDIIKYGSEAVLISRIPGASHCALEGEIISQVIRENFDIPVIEIEVPPITDSMRPAVQTRLEALVEIVKAKPRNRIYNWRQE